ncbi:NB-ARC domain-containing protein [Iningainema tapete]|uniref:NB-ARC domain-containing protein n=1 Tax=Iningainema tapete BLCC-T55 TaxID=2748662 RepID=A0A8J6XMJ7_9CYAN|nr:NB-ARC domain-containing protein [Iningainema tapete]MBD2777728.1 hypothetical protein [Iningainema tapete BLCC-T55]
MPRTTLKASEQGKIRIKQARIEKIEQAKREIIEQRGKIKKGWNIDQIFLREASQILEPNKNWDNIESEEHYFVSLATWKRFREAREAINPETFKVFCEILDLNWQDIAENEVDRSRDLSQAPPPSSFYGRTQELTELQQWLIQERCRLVVIHGMGKIGKAALARQLVEKIADKYDYIIWRSLNSAPPFQTILTEVVQFLSRGQENVGISLLIQSLRQHRCLLVLEDWEEIMGSNSEDYSDYCELLRRVTREAHQSSVLLLSREKPKNTATWEGQLTRFKQLGGLNCEDAKEILKAEGLFGQEDELEEFSRRYSNPWILKKIAQMVKGVFAGEVSGFVQGTSIFVDDDITDFLDRQFQQLSDSGKNVIYWIAIRRNTASWEQLVQDTHQLLSYNQLFYTLDNLIQGRSLVEKNLEEIPILYTLDPVILKYITNRFVEDNYHQIFQIIKSQILQGSELFISHSFITEIPQYELLCQEQIRRIVKPIQEKLYAELRDKQRLEEELKKILSILQQRDISAGYARQNILSLLS